ncbi:MAG: 1-(5-phosphoribosyl)-5-[(5-phosphoribosylamino)methylideneamino]imidazole-4-carboxamide isomerase [Thermomicrobiales bacterium]
MIVYPAIDIRGGRCVRLIEGDFARETIFDADPVDAAERWRAAGATWLHIVDLDGAVAGSPQNLEAIRRIRASVALSIQLGGGLRDDGRVQDALAAGIERVVIGTAAVRDRPFVERIAAAYGDRVAVGLDARDGMLATAGWLEQTETDAARLAVELRAIGVATFIFTDIRRDGTLAGPNLPALRSLHETLGSGVIASGGIGTLADVEAVDALGVEGVIIGRALYDGRVDLAAAIRVTQPGAAQ